MQLEWLVIDMTVDRSIVTNIFKDDMMEIINKITAYYLLESLFNFFFLLKVELKLLLTLPFFREL